MKPAAELRQGSTYRKDNIPYLILKAERHQSTSGKRQRAAEVKFKTKELISGKIQEITVLATDLMDDIILDRNQMQVKVVNPLKQGLKPLHYFLQQLFVYNVKVVNPLKQGLKQI